MPAPPTTYVRSIFYFSHSYERRLCVRRACRRFTDEAAKERKKLDSEVVETEEMKAKRLEKAVRQETIKEQVQVRRGPRMPVDG